MSDLDPQWEVEKDLGSRFRVSDGREIQAKFTAKPRLLSCTLVADGTIHFTSPCLVAQRVGSSDAGIRAHGTPLTAA